MKKTIHSNSKEVIWILAMLICSLLGKTSENLRFLGGGGESYNLLLIIYKSIISKHYST